jgi:hypothetical protein
VPVESVQEFGQVVGGELPLERSGGLVVSFFEVRESLNDRVEVFEDVGREHFSLGDGEVDLVG